MSFCYRLFGLSLASELACPELVPASPGTPADIQIRVGPLAPDLEQASFSSARVQIAPGSYQFLIQGVARYRVDQGRCIQVDAAPDADPGDVRLWLLGTALGALLHQRGLLPLHASALALDEVAHAFCGDSGAGKSTLAAALHRRGLPLLTDDVGLAVADAEQVLLYPGFPHIKLWRDALDHFSLDHRPLIRDPTRTDKYHLRLADNGQAQPRPLRHLYVLERSADDAIRIERVRGHEAIGLIQAHTYRSGLVRRFGLAADHLRQCGRIAQRVRLFRFHRPWGLSRLDDGLDHLLAHMRGARP
jgi:hypothetical protein